MRPYLLVAASLFVGCFQAIPFPGEQAEIVSDQVNDEDTTGVNEAIFDDFVADAFDSDGDGIDDTAVSVLMVVASDVDAETLCDEAQKSNNFAQFLGRFDNARIVTSFTVVFEDLAVGASGFDDNDNIQGDAINKFVTTFFFSVQDNEVTVDAQTADNKDLVEIDVVNALELTANFDGLLQLDFADNPNGDNINADIEGNFFKAAHCEMDEVVLN
jgi:hypothetical protein